MPRLQVRMPGHDRGRSLGNLAAEWMEHFYRHGDGDIHGMKMALDEDFYNFLMDCYAQGEDGRRLYREVILSRAKGTAKSELAGGITLFDAHGPSRCAGFAKGGEVFEQHDFRYVYEPNEPMGTFITDPFIRVMATEENQTGNTFSNILVNLTDQGMPLADALNGRRDFFAGATMVRMPRGAQIIPATSGAASKDGGKETQSTADEVHLYFTPELRRMYDTVYRNMFKRKIAQPWMLSTTTMYQEGQDSIGERLHKKALAIHEGKIKNPGMLFDHLEAAQDIDLSNEEEVREGLFEAYARRTWTDYDAYVAMVSDPMVDPADFRRYQFNQSGSRSDAYVNQQEIAGIVQGGTPEEVKPLQPGDTITLGMDYAPGNKAREDEPSKKKRRMRLPDATGIVACRLSDMSLHVIGLWEANEAEMIREGGWNPPMVEIEATVHATFKKYNVVGMFADPTGLEAHLNQWTAKYIKCLKVVASAARPMYRYMSGASIKQSTADVKNLYEAIASQQVRMANDAALIRHFLAARRVSEKYGLKLYKDHPDSPNKIDLVPCAVMAYAAAVAALNKGLGSARKRGSAKRLY